MCVWVCVCVCVCVILCSFILCVWPAPVAEIGIKAQNSFPDKEMCSRLTLFF